MVDGVVQESQLGLRISWKATSFEKMTGERA
jgi:hypothetical protein